MYSSLPPTSPGHQPEQVDADAHGPVGRGAVTPPPRRSTRLEGARRCGPRRTARRPAPGRRRRAARRSAASSRSRARASARPSTSRGSTSSAGVAGDLRGGGARRGDHRRALGHGLEHRQAEALPQAREAEHGGAGVERPQVVGGDEADGADPVAERAPVGAEVLVPALRARRAPGRRRRGRGARTRVEQRRAGSCGARWCRPRARSGRRGRSGPARRRPPSASAGCGVDAPRHEAEAGGVEAVARRSRRAVACDGHSTRSASRAGQLDGPAEEADARGG